MTAPLSSPELQHRLEQFYYREARLLDERRYRDWLAMCCQDIRYTMPARTNPLVDNRAQGDQAMIAVDRELEGTESDGCPIREENIIHLGLRVERAYKRNAWAENPPARTRRIIGNIEMIDRTDEGLRVLSNFHLFYSRPGGADFFYAGQRRDRLREAEGDFRILSREIIMDVADIRVPTLSLLL